VVEVYGFAKANVQEGVKALTNMEKSQLRTRMVAFPNACNHATALDRCVSRFNVQWSACNEDGKVVERPIIEEKVSKLDAKMQVKKVDDEEFGPKTTSLQLVGLGERVDACAAAVLQMYADSAGGQGKMTPPDFWLPSTKESKRSKFLDVFDIEKDGPEWKRIVNDFRKTNTSNMPSKIQRIQNTLLWDQYASARQRVRLKNGSATELWLWHGTRDTPPDRVYNDSVGFDITYASDGMWGRGLYFASNAQYSHGYTFKMPDGKQQFFYVSVLVGETTQIPADGSLRRPPVRMSGNNTAFAQDRYDSVSGIAEGSLNFIVYQSGRAYPHYLITY